MTERHRIGVLFSTTGPYGLVGRAMQNGAVLAVEEVNAGSLGIALEPEVVDPKGEIAGYAAGADRLLDAGIRHVVGCYTSSSRKEIIPIFEKRDGLLWYPSHYEGFETSENVVYTGASPNQHIVPLVQHLLARGGRTAFCVGSNYIWAWENNRILREALALAGGRVAAERYFAVGETEFGQVIDAILTTRPDFVFNTLIGVSAYQFLRELRRACRARGIDQPRALPVASCSLAEPELEAIGPEAVDGHLSSSVYFSSIDTPRNRAFTAAYAARFPDGPTPSADTESAYIAVHLLARALARAGTGEVAAVRRAACEVAVEAPQGPVRLDETTLHAALTPRIGLSTASARFTILAEAPAPVAPDPYLVRSAPRIVPVLRRPRLRVVPS
ncbi:transporter substrate-binding domain-containing protein [Methylobacterium oryzihabitans]|uniref:Aliphatic amidase expression-regulating protein n=1 Tax=Methylobacterium oryzihabitans TaxID=2499852 RepID=A0A3S2YWS6_9HYPH|nr:transporter substrate-binding domain-containing protein [Methylobacterium oryzihabitans]RVU21198.1 aliphatic amidase expression-regulating protein [Methylobacterium oryzihabitans]